MRLKHTIRKDQRHNVLQAHRLIMAGCSAKQPQTTNTMFDCGYNVLSMKCCVSFIPVLFALSGGSVVYKTKSSLLLSLHCFKLISPFKTSQKLWCTFLEVLDFNVYGANSITEAACMSDTHPSTYTTGYIPILSLQ